ncbi:Inner kinetochore subunit cnp3 [Drechslerella dactyloides]|uniref:Inner kinetochore subunit cnp3 n=1 Tax=Drechslerella dactyloides TaxID=74499 RepID=A0AAD6J4V6_DREDA|nr:Inner kinetochore subunit cnp3 [Drechslerella dactyloides]
MASITNKKRENLHTDVGMVGRKTGFTVQNLPRNDDGMEDMSAFFSSPRAESEARAPDNYPEDLPSDDSHDDRHDMVESRGVSDLASNAHDATPRIRLDSSASMDIEESLLISAFVQPSILPAVSWDIFASPTKVNIINYSFAIRRLTKHTPIPPTVTIVTISDNEAEDDFTSSKENMPKASEEEPAPHGTNHISSISKAQRGMTASTGLRSGGHGSRLLTQGKRHLQLKADSLGQSDDEERDLSIIDTVDSAESANPSSAKTNSHHDSNNSARQTMKNDTTGSNLVGKRKQEASRPRPSDLDRSNTKQRSRGSRVESRTSVGSNTDSIPEEVGQSDTEDAEDARASRDTSASRESPGSNQEESTSNSKNHGIAAQQSNSSLPRRAGRPKKIQASLPPRVRRANSLEQTTQNPTDRTSRQDATTATESVNAGQNQKMQPNPGQRPPLAKRGRKRKLDSLTTEEPTSNLNGLPRSKSDVSGDNAISNREKTQDKSSSTDQAPVLATDAKAGNAQLESDRPKRSRIAPLQYWKNEKRVYTVNERRESGTAVSLTEEVIRIEEKPATRPQRKSRARTQETTVHTKKMNKSGKVKVLNNNDQEDLSDNDTDDEDWEKLEEDEIEDEIAISRNGIEFKPIFGSDYLFAKTMGKEFMGCGILELQTGATKKLKSSGKMQLVFFVLEGKIEAEVNELGFRINRGGQFQVPRETEVE